MLHEARVKTRQFHVFPPTTIPTASFIFRPPEMKKREHPFPEHWKWIWFESTMRKKTLPSTGLYLEMHSGPCPINEVSKWCVQKCRKPAHFWLVNHLYAVFFFFLHQNNGTSYSFRYILFFLVFIHSKPLVPLAPFSSEDQIGKKNLYFKMMGTKKKPVLANHRRIKMFIFFFIRILTFCHTTCLEENSEILYY